MYAYIDGKITVKNPTYVVIETGGIGYYINISLHTYAHIPDLELPCRLYTWLHAIKDAGPVLYGFLEELERRMFLHLISVSRTGPNTARAILSSITPTEIQQAIVQGHTDVIQQIKGVGGKAAQRIVFELQDKLKKEYDGTTSTLPSHTVIEDALSALRSLGFASDASEKALDHATKTLGASPTAEALIKTALKNL